MNLKHLAEADQFHKWYSDGVTKGWISPMYCETHDGSPLTDVEMDDLDDGWDICITAVRIYLPDGGDE